MVVEFLYEKMALPKTTATTSTTAKQKWRCQVQLLLDTDCHQFHFLVTLMQILN